MIGRYIGALVVLSVLSGCAGNTIRLDRAGSVSAAGDAAVTETNKFIQRVKDTRTEANVTLIASDPSCTWGKTIVLRGERRRGPGSLCLPRGTAANTDLGDVEINLEDISAEELKPTLTSLNALSHYLEAVNKVLTDKDPDIAAEISETYSKALDAQSDLSVITGQTIGLVPQITADQQAAIKGILTLVTQLAQEQGKVDRLRLVILNQQPLVAEILSHLRSTVLDWRNGSLVGDLQSIDTTYVSLGRQLGARPARYVTLIDRLTVLRAIVSAHRAAAVAPQAANTLIKALDELSAAQADLIDGLSAHPHWTAAERRKAARINRARLLSALHAVAAVVSAF